MEPNEAERPAVAVCLALVAGMVLALEGHPALPATALTLLALLAPGAHAPVVRAAAGVALLAGWQLMMAGQGSGAEQLPRLPVERELSGKLLALPEPEQGGCILLLRGDGLTVRFRVASSNGCSTTGLGELRTGDRVNVWGRIAGPRGHANPGSRDPAIWMRARGLDGSGAIKSSLLVELSERGRAGPRRWIDDLKQMARSGLDRAFGRGNGTRAVMGAVLLGDRAALAPEQNRALRYAGLIHLVAISGLHAGLMAMMLFGGLRRARCSPGLLFTISLVLLPAFSLLVGARPPVLRAAAASGLLLFGRWRGREGEPLNSLALVAALFLVMEPRLLLDAGFQLTFTATAGILLFAPRVAERVPLPRLVALPAAVSIAAYIGCAPVLALHFGWLAPVALISNLVAAPLCAVLITGGYGTLLFSWLPPLREAAIGLSLLSVSSLQWVAEAAGGLPLAGWRVPPPALPILCLYYLLLGALGLKRKSRPLALALFLGLLVFIHTGGAPRRPAAARVAVLDVGQGQSVALEGPEGAALIDAAGSSAPRYDPGERIVLPYFAARGLRRIDLLAISHGDIDHAGGAFALLREMEIGRLWLAPAYHDHPLLGKLAAAARSRGTEVVLAERGMIFDGIGIRLRVEAPDREVRELEGNDRSLVIRAGARPCRLLIAGDLEQEGERAMLDAGGDPEAEALIVAHHGSSGGSGALFLSRVGARHAVISCGFNNRYGHPRPDVLRRLDESGATVYRTDLDGMVLLEAGREGWTPIPTLDRRRTAAE